MKNHLQKPVKIFTLLLCAALLLTGCGGDSGEPGAPSQADTPEKEPGGNAASGSITMEAAGIDEKDFYADWESGNYTSIALSGENAVVSGAGASVSGSVVTIAAEGTYVLSGTMDDGVILVDASKEADVRLVLNNASLHCETGAPVFVRSADKVIVSLPEGTANTLSDAAEYTYAAYDATEDEPSAALFAKSDLVINGEGSLTVEGNHRDGIAAKDDLKITGGSLGVKAVDDGVIGKDFVAVTTARLTVDAGGDGVKSTNSTDAGRGFVALADGEYTITSGADAIQAETSLYIAGGKYTLESGGGCGQTTSFGKADQYRGRSPWNAEENAADETSAKGLKAGAELVIEGGSFSLSSAEDAIHSNGTAEIRDGAFTISAADDGIHADTRLEIGGGTTEILQSYEGVESAEIVLSGGRISVVSSDDGLNAAGGNDQSEMGRPGGMMGGMDGFSSGVGSITLSGAELTINAGGDGIDSNGTVTMTGGTVLVSGPTDSGNGALDFESSFAVSGGTLVAVGSVGMAEIPTSDSTQLCIAGTVSSSGAAGSTVALRDEAGKILTEFTAAKSYQHVIISTPDIASGGNYSVTIDGETVGQVTASSVITTFGNSSGGMGGMDPGGNRGGFPGGNFPGGDPGEMPGGDFPGGNGGQTPPNGDPGQMTSGVEPGFPGGDRGGMGRGNPGEMPGGDFPGGMFGEPGAHSAET